MVDEPMTEPIMMRPNPRFLSCKQDIKVYLGNITDHMFKKYVMDGMPARYDGRRWYASTANLDKWWDAYTMVSMKAIIDQIPDEAG